MRSRMTILISVLLAAAGLAHAAEETPLLANSPTLSKTQVVFAYGGYLWSVPRDGGDARQLTTGGHEGDPIFSPDGKWRTTESPRILKWKTIQRRLRRATTGNSKRPSRSLWRR